MVAGETILTAKGFEAFVDSLEGGCCVRSDASTVMGQALIICITGN
jgi:hypothetical protein